jgi:hypothetical protein
VKPKLLAIRRSSSYTSDRVQSPRDYSSAEDHRIGAAVIKCSVPKTQYQLLNQLIDSMGLDLRLIAFHNELFLAQQTWLPGSPPPKDCKTMKPSPTGEITGLPVPLWPGASLLRTGEQLQILRLPPHCPMNTVIPARVVEEDPFLKRPGVHLAIFAQVDGGLRPACSH